jgi:hypothetical protein
MNQGILLGPDGRPWSKADVEIRTKLLNKRGSAITSSMLPGPNPMFWNDEELGIDKYGDLLSHFIKPHDVSFGGEDEQADYAATIATNPNTYNERFAKRNPISELNKPRDIHGVFSAAMGYAEDNYIVNRTVKIKKNFAMKQMTILGSEAQKKFYNSELRRLRVRQWISHIFRYHYICGRVVVYWGEERPIEGLCLLDPRFIVVRRFLTKTNVYFKPDKRWVSVLSNGAENDPAYKFLKANLPKYWIPFIKKGEEIPLKDETFALIENDLSLFASRGIPDYSVEGTPLSAAFDALQIMKMLIAGDFSVAWMLKNLIALISIGDPEHEADYSPPDQIELRKLELAFQRPEYAMNAFVDPTVNIRYIHPDPALFDDAKYKQVTRQIEYVCGVPGVFSGSDSTFAAGSISLKPFREDIEVGRIDVEEQFLWKLWPVLREGVTDKKAGGNSDPEVDWDRDCLMDDKAIQSELQGQWDRGAISNQSLLEGKGRDFDTELKRKQEELKYKDILQPLFDVAHGNMDGGDGRPSNSGAPTSASANGGSTPRASTSTK